MSTDDLGLEERYPGIDGPLDHRIAYVLRSGVFSSPIAIKTFKDLAVERDKTRHQVADAPHGAYCPARISRKYICSCWKSGR